MTEALIDLRRPRLLVRAARFGLSDNEDSGRAVDAILADEAKCEDMRCNFDSDYSPTRHVELLIELMLAARRPTTEGGE